MFCSRGPGLRGLPGLGFRRDVRPLEVPRSTACPEPSQSTPRGVHLFSEGYVAPLSFSFYIYFLETAHCPSLRTNRLSFQNSSEIGFPRICSFYKPVTNFKRTVAADKKKLARAIYENERYRNLESSAQSEKEGRVYIETTYQLEKREMCRRALSKAESRCPRDTAPRSEAEARFTGQKHVSRVRSHERCATQRRPRSSIQSDFEVRRKARRFLSLSLFVASSLFPLTDLPVHLLLLLSHHTLQSAHVRLLSPFRPPLPGCFFIPASLPLLSSSILIESTAP